MTTEPPADAFGPIEPTDADRAGIAEENLSATRMQLDETTAQRDKLVEAIGRMVSLPPRVVAEAYGVGYAGTNHLTQPTCAQCSPAPVTFRCRELGHTIHPN